MKVVLCFLVLAALAVTLVAADVNVTGKWSGTFTAENGDGGNAFMTQKQAGNVITGTAGGDENDQWEITKGKIDGKKLTAEVHNPDGTVYNVDLVVVDADHIKGDVVVNHEGQTMKGKLEVERVK